MNTIMLELYKAPLHANICSLVLVWCKHGTAKIQQAELLHKISPCPRLFSKDHYEPSTFLRDHHKPSPHSFYPKTLQSWGDSMELFNTVVRTSVLNTWFFNINIFMSTSTYFSTGILKLFIEYQHTFPGYHFTLVLLPLTFEDMLKSNCKWSTSTNGK